jgi:hypothetical protein
VLQVSVKKEIADLFDFQAVREVIVRRVSEESVTLEYVELTFKDQYISRCDMLRFKQSLVGQCIHKNKKPFYLGVRAQVKEVICEGQPVWSGAVTSRTKVIFRSRSARIYLLIQVFFVPKAGVLFEMLMVLCATQLSKEMWEFDEDGDLYFEKAVRSCSFVSVVDPLSVDPLCVG